MQIVKSIPNFITKHNHIHWGDSVKIQLSGLIRTLSNLQKHLQWTEIGTQRGFTFLAPGILHYVPDVDSAVFYNYSNPYHSPFGILRA